jgi:asparagine synthase (glutamine-hydrolysing)
VRSYAPGRQLGFSGFSPYALPNVIAVAEAIPYVELTEWDPTRLYALKADIVRRGIEATTELTMPLFEKRRFQHGVVDDVRFGSVFPTTEAAYRAAFLSLYE